MKALDALQSCRARAVRREAARIHRIMPATKALVGMSRRGGAGQPPSHLASPRRVFDSVSVSPAVCVPSAGDARDAGIPHPSDRVAGAIFEARA